MGKKLFLRILRKTSVTNDGEITEKIYALNDTQTPQKEKRL